MKQIIYYVIFILVFTSCQSKKHELKSYESEIVTIEKINKNIFKHTSYLETDNFGKVSCNGMVFVSQNEAIIFDTPTNNKASKALIDWLGNTKIKAVVVTHFHIDCLGGLEAFHSNNVKSYANKLTINLAEKDHQVLPQEGFDNLQEFIIGGTKVYAEFFGEGHTKDNVVGYIPSEKALFGGCLIKTLGANEGSVSDANVNEWSKTVSRIKNEMFELQIVIPGHGKSGDSSLLDYTIELFDEK